MGKVVKKIAGVAVGVAGVATKNAGLISAGVGMLGSSGGGSSGAGNVAGGAYYDPYAAYRSKAANTLDALLYGRSPEQITSANTAGYNQYVAQYNSLGKKARKAQGPMLSQSDWTSNYGMTTPVPGGSPTDMIKAMPGYQFGMNQGAETLNRTMAATGQTQSGAQQVALSEYGQQYAGSFYDKMINNLMGMSGATQSPMNVTGQNALNAQQSNLNTSTMMSAVGAGIQGLGNIFNWNGPAPLADWIDAGQN